MTYDEIAKALSDAKVKLAEKANGKTLREELLVSLSKAYSRRTVLGIDIYRYSKMEIVAQTLVPYVLKKLYFSAAARCLKKETFFFPAKSEEWFDQSNIDTGDGYFQIFDNPIQALIFLIHFEAELKILNSMNGSEDPEIAMIFEQPLVARYTITEGPIFDFDGTKYGKGIIDCARIISKDRLNRLLIDRNVSDYFVINFNGIETLQVTSLEDLRNIKDLEHDPNGLSVLFLPDGDESAISRLDIQQIEKVSVKDDDFEIFNVYLQVFIRLTEPIELAKQIVSVGNLNSTGL